VHSITIRWVSVSRDRPITFGGQVRTTGDNVCRGINAAPVHAAEARHSSEQAKPTQTRPANDWTATCAGVSAHLKTTTGIFHVARQHPQIGKVGRLPVDTDQAVANTDHPYRQLRVPPESGDIPGYSTRSGDIDSTLPNAATWPTA